MPSGKVDVKKLLEAGAHFGHKTSRWHPKMSVYIYGKKAGNHIIDLTKTEELLNTALDFITKQVAAGKKILLISTKRQAKDKVAQVAIATGMPYVTVRWLGGMLTNQATIGSRIRHLKDLEKKMETGELGTRYSKLEVQKFQEEIDEMNRLYGGIKDMDDKPGAIFVADMQNDDIAIKEARKRDIPVVAIADTNSDPTLANYPIPANDDSTKTINLILDYIQLAIENGQAKAKEAKSKTETKKETDK